MKMKAKADFHTDANLLLYILQKYFVNKSGVFLKPHYNI